MLGSLDFKNILIVGGIILLPAFIGALALPDWIVTHLLTGYARGMAVLGLLVLMRAGFVSFGHALYLGIGGYGTVLVERLTGNNEVAFALAFAILCSGALSFLLGFVLKRYRGIFFAMLNLAFSMVLYGLLVRSEVLGSSDGFTVSPPTIFGFSPSTHDLGSRPLLVFVALLGLIGAGLVGLYFKSVIGSTVRALQENETRLEFMGLSPDTVVHVKYVISAILAGAAGACLATTLGQVDPDSLVNWTASGELVFITVLAGTGSLAAPFAGAVIFEFLRTYATEFAPNLWQIIVGGALLGTVMFLPEGLGSLFVKAPPLSAGQRSKESAKR